MKVNIVRAPSSVSTSLSSHTIPTFVHTGREAFIPEADFEPIGLVVTVPDLVRKCHSSLQFVALRYFILFCCTNVKELRMS
jgi:hypothetical protein